MGILFYSKEGRLIDANPSALKITGTSSLKDCAKLNLFNKSYVASKKEELLKKGLIKFQTPLNFQNGGDGSHDILKKPKTIFIEWNIAAINAGYLVQIQDITASKNEEPLKSEDKYKRWFEDDLTGDFIATTCGQIIDCNPAFAEIYGFDNCEKAVESNICDFNRDDWINLITSLKIEYKIYDHQSWHKRPDGIQIHVVANVIGIFDDSDELVQVKGYVFDDTERKNAEEMLTNSKRQISEILDSIKDNFIALNHYWNFIYVNKSASEYFGVEADDLIGQNLWERFPELVKTRCEEIFRKTMETNEIQHFEAPSMHRTGQWFDFSVYPSSEGISVYWRDITERKMLEK